MQSFDKQPVKQAPFESIDDSKELSPAKKLFKKKTIIIDFTASKKKEALETPRKKLLQDDTQKRVPSPLPKDVKVRLITTPRIQSPHENSVAKKPIVLLDPGTITSIPLSKIRISVPATARNPLSTELTKRKQEPEARSQSQRRISIKKKSIQLIKTNDPQLVKP